MELPKKNHIWSSLSSSTRVGSVAQSCPTPCDLMDCSPPGSSVHGISQARILEWVAISSFRGSSQTRDPNLRLPCLLHCRQVLHPLSHCRGKFPKAKVIPGTLPSAASPCPPPMGDQSQTSADPTQAGQVAGEQEGSRKEVGKTGVQRRDGGGRKAEHIRSRGFLGIEAIPATSGAGFPQEQSWVLQNRVSFLGKSRLHEPEESETAAHSGRTQSCVTHRPALPAPSGSAEGHGAGSTGGVPSQPQPRRRSLASDYIQHVGTQAGCWGHRGGSTKGVWAGLVEEVTSSKRGRELARQQQRGKKGRALPAR